MKRFSVAILAALALAAALISPPAKAQFTTSFPMLTAVTATSAACSASTAINAKAFPALRTFSASGTTSAGAGSATVIIYGSNLGTDTWVSLGTITLTLATTITAVTNTDGFVSQAPWPFLCARVTAIAGTNATVTVNGATQ